MVVSSPQAKTQYSEVEAAVALGVTVEQLRSLIRSHIVDNDVDPRTFSVSNLHPSDLLVLKFLSCTSPATRD